jgi:hypothetical protein
MVYNTQNTGRWTKSKNPVIVSIEVKQLEILSTGEPTYWPTYINKTSDLLEFFVFKGL